MNRGCWPCRILSESPTHLTRRFGTITAWWWSDPTRNRWLASVVVEPHGLVEVLPGDRLQRATEEEAWRMARPGSDVSRPP